MRSNHQLPLAIALSAAAFLLSLTSTADARLFRQTFGSVVPAEDGCGCQWNVNQDYFVPRYATSCRYGLFSPCKTSCTSSPACKRCHPLYPGYCSNYGPLHYCWRNHVYRVHCGCTPIRPYKCGCAFGLGCGCGSGCVDCHGSTCEVPMRVHRCCLRLTCKCATMPTCCPCGSACCYPHEYIEQPHWLPHVEPAEFKVLGSIPVEGNELLAGGNLSLLEQDASLQDLLLGTQATSPSQTLPLLGKPQSELITPPAIPAD